MRNSKNQLIELQLKGSGLTPYSRRDDGKAVLRSTIREFLCSEAMHYLGIPTTRAACITLTDDYADRDPLEDGNHIKEATAVLFRLAPTMIRFGSFQICVKGGPSEGLEKELIPRLADYVIENHMSHLS